MSLRNLIMCKNVLFIEMKQKHFKTKIAHPFMEGNGRSARICLDMRPKKAGDHRAGTQSKAPPKASIFMIQTYKNLSDLICKNICAKH